MMPEAPSSHAFVHVADIRIDSPKSRAFAEAQVEAAAEKRAIDRERERFFSIMSSPEAQFRLGLALYITCKTDMNTGEALSLLKVAGEDFKQ